MCSPRPGGAGPVGRVLVPQSGRFQVDLKGEALAWSKGRQPQPYTCSHDRPLHCCASLQPLCAHLPLPAPPCPPVRPPSPPLRPPPSARHPVRDGGGAPALHPGPGADQERGQRAGACGGCSQVHRHGGMHATSVPEHTLRVVTWHAAAPHFPLPSALPKLDKVRQDINPCLPSAGGGAALLLGAALRARPGLYARERGRAAVWPHRPLAGVFACKPVHS